MHGSFSVFRCLAWYCTTTEKGYRWLDKVLSYSNYVNRVSSIESTLAPYVVFLPDKQKVGDNVASLAHLIVASFISIVECSSTTSASLERRIWADFPLNEAEVLPQMTPCRFFATPCDDISPRLLLSAATQSTQTRVGAVFVHARKCSSKRGRVQNVLQLLIWVSTVVGEVGRLGLGLLH